MNLVSQQDNVETVLVELDKVAANLETDKKFLT